MAAEVGTKLNLQRPNRALLTVDAPRLERSHGRLDFAAIFGIHPHHASVGEKAGRQRKAEVDEFCAQVPGTSYKSDTDFARWRCWLWPVDAGSRGRRKNKQ